MNRTSGPHIPAKSMFACDFDALRIDECFTGLPRTVTASDVSVFAGLTGDHHPIHVDPEWAASGPFGRPIAHGLLIISCAVGSLPLEADRVIALRRIRDVVFKRPLGVGDSMAVRCKVSGLKPIDDETGLVECEWRIVDQNQKLLTRAIVEILWRRDAADWTRDAVHSDDDGLRVFI